ncbi:MAG: hypothetical protein AAF039_05065 [Bacteroidota bacterium]
MSRTFPVYDEYHPIKGAEAYEVSGLGHIELVNDQFCNGQVIGFEY